VNQATRLSPQTDRADVHTDLTTQSLNNLPTPLGRNYQLLLPVMVPDVATPTSGGGLQRHFELRQQPADRGHQRHRFQRQVPDVHAGDRFDPS